jgi:hypothetical protein
MDLNQAKPAIARASQEDLCPFIGLPEDSQTALSYPSSWNVCHHTKPAGIPNLYFQQSFCFSKNHCTCPVYTRLERYPLPTGIRLQIKKPPIQKRLVLFLSIGGVVLAFAIAGLVRVLPEWRDPNGSLSANLMSPTPIAIPAVVLTDPLPLTSTPLAATALPPTLTDIPTLTLTGTPAGPTLHPTDTRWPSPTRSPTPTTTSLPQATATFSRP